mmetsp:Transcript_31692/g.62707  ORF Transcript_31692/g.62707 Transcript_31692/m.62707 type:complete len:89 (+) Transcript_31692:560-826(+)
MGHPPAPNASKCRGDVIEAIFLITFVNIDHIHLSFSGGLGSGGTELSPRMDPQDYSACRMFWVRRISRSCKMFSNDSRLIREQLFAKF